MLYELAHFLQNSLKPVWALAESVNAWLFQIRYNKRLRQIPAIISAYPGVERVGQGDVAALTAFFASQPAWVYIDFRPHGFDAASVAKLVKNRSKLMFVVREQGQIIGYFFLRSFFIGKTYLGKMVDAQRQSEGIGQMMCSCAMDIASALGLRMFESISKDNIASITASQKVLETRVIKELGNGYLFLEDIRKKPVCG